MQELVEQAERLVQTEPQEPAHADRQVREVHLDALHHPGHHQNGRPQQRVRHQAEEAPQPDVRLPQEVRPDVRHHQATFQLPEVPLLIEVRDDAEETLIMG